MTQEEENIPSSGEDVGDLGRLNISGFSEGNIPSPYPPENPIMSEFKETAPGSGHWYARSGGPSKNDWSDLDDNFGGLHKWASFDMKSSPDGAFGPK